ncbi:MAG: sensor histidine kinase [Gloeocapsa sp. DLM2.Bin57]|nr:MAG: sensor histidine kinase [Gloeocapsa sp. DLM2.Bin57]
MVVKHWSLPTLSDLFYRYECQQTAPKNQPLVKVNPKTASQQYHQALTQAEQEWFAAIAAMEALLENVLIEDTEAYQGIILSSPISLLSNHNLLTGVFTTEAFEQLSLTSLLLPSATEIPVGIASREILQLPLLPKDPLTSERYGLLLTSSFSLAIVLGKDNLGFPKFYFSFVPELIEEIWHNLKTRLSLTNHPDLELLESTIAQFPPLNPDYRLVTKFSRYLLDNLAIPQKSTNNQQVNTLNKEIELLQAFTHEIRTPLTTIRTLTRLLLKRSQQLSTEILARLEMIDQECTEQINRMDLIFKATEFKKQPVNPPLQLLPICLDKLFQENIPRWQKQSQRRNVILDIVLPQKLPIILGDPAMLEQVLTNLMEKITKDLATGGKIRVEVTIAGDQLKLELLALSHYPANPLKSLGELLMFQPETGSLTLNMNVTKNLFNLMGGKLTIRQQEDTGEVFTIFLPLKTTQTY